jgi:hypothetical protein
MIIIEIFFNIFENYLIIKAPFRRLTNHYLPKKYIRDVPG